MAFNTQEIEIIRYGKQNGKSRQEVESAIANFRAGVVKPIQAEVEQDNGYASRVKESVKSSLGEAWDSQVKSGKGEMNPLAAGANIAKNVTGAVLAPIIEAPIVKQIGEGLGKAGEAIVDTEVGNKVTDKIASVASPETIGAVSDVIETGLNVAGVKGMATGVKGAVSKTSSAVDSAIDSTKVAVEKVKQKVTPKSAKSPLESAIEDATPDYESLSPSKKGKYLDRVEEGGVFEGRKIKPSKLETEAGTELSKVPNYDPSGTKLSKYKATKAEIAKKGEAFKESLKQEKVAVPKREIVNVVNKAVKEVPNRSLLLQKSDPVIASYVRVFKNALKKEPGNLSGVQNLIETLDDAYENARGKQAFGSDKISALDDVHKASRDALTKYLIEKAQLTEVKIAKRSLWNLYRALDELRTMAEKESGSSVGRFMQKNPKATQAIKTVGQGVGLGGALNLVD